MNEINFFIDGREAEASDGMTILEAAQANGVDIPHLCHAEYLQPTGACRLCVVEVEGQRALMPSCAVKVSPDMKVSTGTERVVRARKMVLELLLSAHPKDCMTCDMAGKCLLQKYCYEYGVSDTRFKGGAIYNYPEHRDNPFYVRDYNKCILCGRCVNACAEIQGDFIIDFAHRGFATMISTPLNRNMKDSGCVFCGNCVAACPTGALRERDAAGVAREWELNKVSTTCPYCGCGCQLDLNVKDGKVVKVTSNPSAPVNGVALCSKGRFGYGFIHSPERLTVPLVREDGELKPATWKKALDFAARRLCDIQGESGADSIAGLASARCTNEENYLFQKFMRAVIGTNNVDHCARLCHASTVAGLAISFGSGAMTNTIADISQADVILITGSNTTETHPIIALQVKKAARRGAKIIVVEPRRIQLCDIAEIHLCQKSGSDVAWINGFINVIISEGLHDASFIENRTEGFEEMKAAVKKYTPEYVENITGIPADALRAAARVYATAEKAAILYSMGITQHTSGTNNVMSVANLAMLTGNIGKPGTGVNPLRGQNNVQGSCDMGALPNVFSGYQQVSNPDARKKFSAAWKAELPESSGLTATEMMRAAIKGDIKAMYIMGENPMVSDPDTGHVRKALEKLDLLIVQDIFITETAKLADVVLPAVCFAEKDGTFTNTERRVQRVRAAVAAPGDSKQDWRIIGELAMRFGYRMDYESPERIMEEIASLTPSYGGVDYERIDREAVHWPCPSKSHPGTPILHIGAFTRGKGKFAAVEFSGPDEVPDADYPMTLITGRILYHYHTGTMTRRSRPLDEHVPQAFFQINPEDARSLNIADGQFCDVTSRRGAISIAAAISDAVPEGSIFIPFHFAEAAANALTNSALDPIAKIPELKVCAARVSPKEDAQRMLKY